MSVREKDNPALFAKVQEQNLLRQYDLLSNCIEIGLEKGIEAFDKYTLWGLNYAAVANISQFGGRYREEPIYVGNHCPPHFKDVPNEMDRFFSVVHENWTIMDHPTMLPAYALWRLNWIHPFADGNGRTSRIVSYVVLSIRAGAILPGTPTIPDQIVDNRNPYFEALDSADAACREGKIEVSKMENLLAKLLARQLAGFYQAAGGKLPE